MTLETFKKIIQQEITLLIKDYKKTEVIHRAVSKLCEHFGPKLSTGKISKNDIHKKLTQLLEEQAK